MACAQFSAEVAFTAPFPPGEDRVDGRVKPGHGRGPRPSLSDGAGRCPRIADVDRVHGGHDNADFDFPKANVRTDSRRLAVAPADE